jgi:hypothetical protein
MAKTKQAAISDEEIIAALLSSGTIREAAQAAGISERALYERMKGGNFQALYKSAKADTIRAAVVSLNSKLQAAIETVFEIMQDQEANPATRLQAAQTILNNAGKLADRLQAAENITAQQQENNDFLGV